MNPFSFGFGNHNGQGIYNSSFFNHWGTNPTGMLGGNNFNGHSVWPSNNQQQSSSVGFMGSYPAIGGNIHPMNGFFIPPNYETGDRGAQLLVSNKEQTLRQEQNPTQKVEMDRRIQSLPENSSKQLPFRPPNQPDILTRHLQTYEGCICTKSRCIKDYCKCFKKGILCTEKCRCNFCHNMEPTRRRNGSMGENDKDDRNNDYGKKSKRRKKEMKCNCEKTHCNNRYCDCFAMGRKCGETCGCLGCSNK